MLYASLAPTQDLVKEGSGSEWLPHVRSGPHRVGRTQASPPLHYTSTPPSYPFTSTGHQGTHLRYRSGHARAGWTPSPRGTINPELPLARLVENLAHTLGGCFSPWLVHRPQTFMSFPKVSCRISLLQGEGPSGWLSPLPLAWDFIATWWPWLPHSWA